MADKAPPPSKTHPATPVVIPFLIMLLLGSVAVGSVALFFKNSGLMEFFQLFFLFFTGQATLGDIASMTSSSLIRFLIQLFLFVSFMGSLLLFFLVLSIARKTMRAYNKLVAPLNPPQGTHSSPATHTASFADNPPPAVSDVNPKWLNVLKHIGSDNAADWKLAILEADIMLDAVLEKMGYPGQTVSEKLKLVEKSDFDTLDYAWEAHKIRNNIAHEGSDFILTKEEAERVITMFERVFKEFKYI